MSRFVRPDTVRLYLADVARRGHETLVAAHAGLLKRVTPAPPTLDEIASSEQRVLIAARRMEYAKEEKAWIEVRKRLSSGEQRAAYGRMYLAGVDGDLKVNPLQSGLAVVTAYLLDWSLTDDANNPVVIRGVSAAHLTATLDALDIESFTEIKTAIEQHESDMLAERAAEKQVPFTESASLPT